jgi:hypothetical protein
MVIHPAASLEGLSADPVIDAIDMVWSSAVNRG